MLRSKNILKKNNLEARQSWIYAVLLMSVGPVGPRGGGIYSIIEDVVCQAYVLRTGLKPNNCGYMQFCLCLWALSGPGVGYIQLLRTVCVKYICLKHLPIGDIYP